MNIYEIMFLLGFITMIGFVFSKIYNVIKLCTWMEGEHSFMMFIGMIVIWFVTMVSFMSNITNYHLGNFLIYSNYLFLLGIIMSLMELFIFIYKHIDKKTKELGMNRERYVPQNTNS